MKGLKSCLNLSLLAALSTVLPAQADAGFFLGLQGGYSSIDTDKDIVELKDDINAQLYAGYMFTDWIGLELAYTDFGSFEVKDAQDLEVDYTGVHFGLVLEGNFSRHVNVFAKLGAYNINTEIDYADPADKDQDESDTGFFYQAGLAFPVMRHMDITVSWQNFRKIEILDTSINSGIDAYDLGLRFTF
jgi:opacity protein-like surface antigen